MRRIRKGGPINFDDLDDDDASAPYRYRSSNSRGSVDVRETRSIRSVYSRDEDDEDEEYDNGKEFLSLESKVRSGKYKPKPEDPWNIHFLYQTLIDLGEIDEIS